MDRAPRFRHSDVSLLVYERPNFIVPSACLSGTRSMVPLVRDRSSTPEVLVDIKIIAGAVQLGIQFKVEIS